MQQEARDIIQQPKAWKTFDSQEGCEQNFVQGPHLYYNGTIWQIVRIHGDSSGSFLTAHSHLARRAASEKSSAIFQTLKFLGTRYQTFGIAVPARALRADLRTLQGLRFAVKHTYRLRGLKTSLCNTDYLNISQPSDITAMVVRNMLAAGVYVLGVTKFSSMIGKEEPTEATDYQAPFNPRGDGYRSVAGSNSGCAATAAVATYDWLDFAIGTDTTGSGQRPALVNVIFQMRSTYDAAFLDL